MPGKTFRFTGLTKGCYAAANLFDQPQGSLPRVHNMLLTERGSLQTIDGTHIVSAPPLPPPTPPESPYAGIYVADNSAGPGLGSILVYSLGSTGNVAPIRQISGVSHTTLDAPLSVCVDSDGYVYVVDGTPAIKIFSPGSTGDVAPALTLTGADTTLVYPNYCRIGPDGDLWILDGGTGAGAGYGSVLRFPVQTGGNYAPISTMKSTALFTNGASAGTSGLWGLDWDKAGNFYISNSNSQIIYSFAAGAVGINVNPATAITGINGTFFVHNYGTAIIGDQLFVSVNDFVANVGFIYEWAKETSGNFGLSPNSGVGEGSTAIINNLGMHKDTSNNVWIANRPGAAGGTPSVLAFPASDFPAGGGPITGPAPVVNIHGASTLLLDPYDVNWFFG